MKCLVVIAHPLEDSLCHHLAGEVIHHLTAKGYVITVKDLYKENFDPVLSATERAGYYAEQFDVRLLKDDIIQLQEAESLVFIFPTWWFSFPAILKGWFDRVWAPGYAYNHASDLGAISPCLTGLKEVKVVTTLGAPWWVDFFIVQKPVKKVLKTALLGACTTNCTFRMLSLYRSENISQARVAAFVKKIQNTF
ncbi:MAG TPA: flavodoxin family protein [Desulfobulbus sp.]|nr:flavodoxin family protein [Desulfobulbus sp.]